MPTPSKGYYIEGKRVPGTTTIIGRFKDSSPLLYWACEQGKAIERREISSLYDKRDLAADIGTAAHDMADKYLKGGNPVESTDYLSLAPEGQSKALQAFDMFLEWWEGTNLKIRATEVQLTSEKYKYGGTPDWILETPKGLAMGDIKTSNGIYTDYLIQVAAYKQLWDENYPEEPIVGGFHICRFSKDFPDFDHKYCAELDLAFRQFVLFREAYDIDKELRKRV